VMTHTTAVAPRVSITGYATLDVPAPLYRKCTGSLREKSQDGQRLPTTPASSRSGVAVHASPAVWAEYST
jgi:hypothetical protein